MKLYSTLINYAFNYVIETSKLYNIDDSHSLRHSMEVFNFANQIYNQEIIYNPELINQKNIIMCSAIIHDMCDNKYVEESKGLIHINNHFKNLIIDEDLHIINSIISTMSYSTVKKNGYPELNTFNKAFHIVREADLLAAYDVERCILYQMIHNQIDYQNSLEYVKLLFKDRILKYIENNLFTSTFSLSLAKELHIKALNKLEEIDAIYFDLS
jgi:hypothetical protein